MKHFTLTLMMSAALVGCATFEDYTPPDNPKGTAATDLTAVNTERFIAAAPVASWWREFNDPQLAALVDEALQANLDVKIAIANLYKARAIARESGFDRFPTVTSSASYARERLSREGISGAPLDRTVNNYSAGFDAFWELDLLGRVSQRIDAQEALEQAAEADLDHVYVSIGAEVARVYVELRGAQYRLDIAERNAKNQQSTFDLTKKLENGGRATGLDVARAETQLSLTRATIPPLQAEVSANINRLSVLTGRVPDALREDLSGKKPLPSLPVGVAVGDASSLIKRRPDIRQAERELAAAVAQYNVATTDLFPTVNILGSIGFLATNLSSFGAGALAASVGPTINWRAFDLGRVQAQIDQNDAAAQAALANYGKVALEALEETQTALSNFSREEERRAMLQRAAKSSRTAANLARQRFDQGADTFLNVLDAERTQLESEDALARSEIDAASDLIAIYKALGGGWEVVSRQEQSGEPAGAAVKPQEAAKIGLD
jgi:multidrug efflux system outer membrane protein